MAKLRAACMILAGLTLSVSTIGGDVAAVENAADDRTAYGLLIRPLTEAGDGKSLLNVYGPGYAPVGTRMARGGSWSPPGQFPVHDHLGSARVSVSAHGDAAASHEYAPYGTSANAHGPAYAGHPYDASRGLYETPSRAYDPSQGRFLSRDTTPGGASPYSYAGLNPITNLDPGGNTDIPFFIGSGFATGENTSHYSHGLVGSVKTTIDNTGPRQVIRDDRLFSYHENEFAGGKFRYNWQKIVRANMDAYSYRHSDVVYWLVGNDASVDVRKPLDVAEVFSQWRNLRPGIASKVMIVDVSWDADRSRPIRDALDEAGIGYAFIRTAVTVHENDESTRSRISASTFRIGGNTVERDGFATYVQHVLGQLDPQTTVPGWTMPPPNQTSAGLQPSLSEAGPSSAPDPTTWVTSITTDQPPVEPMETSVPNGPTMDEVSLRHGSDPMLSSSSIGEIPVIVPAPLDSVRLEPTIRD